MMMSDTDRVFPAEYEATYIDLPSAGDVDYEFLHEYGRAMASTVLVEPWSGPSWTGSFVAPDPLIRRATSGLFGTPSPVQLCVVERGSAFLVSVLNPRDYEFVRTDGPVLSVEQIVEESRLLLLTPWSITAVGVDGVAWTTRRVAIEGLRADEVAGGWLRGVADPVDDEPRDFAVNLKTGEVVGGA
ncbi:hypothetical protein [Phytoactinopolyspora halotolerans]|uniref:Uncharacterized protein n=1 Tax=Phytoactinopolyspora halotolerans TaxID=1981512 RepID=A0A6L9SJX1_9ACTN|nr:hypothetical protein [Phytoactinopolyspora halotolerans]NEE04702.1 hypothetical protein [Phytoactinopolyspora halotolerans]